MEKEQPFQQMMLRQFNIPIRKRMQSDKGLTAQTKINSESLKDLNIKANL